MEILKNLNIVYSWYWMSLNNFLKTVFSVQLKLPCENDFKDKKIKMLQQLKFFFTKYLKMHICMHAHIFRHQTKLTA